MFLLHNLSVKLKHSYTMALLAKDPAYSDALSFSWIILLHFVCALPFLPYFFRGINKLKWQQKRKLKSDCVFFVLKIGRYKNAMILLNLYVIWCNGTQLLKWLRLTFFRSHLVPLTQSFSTAFYGRSKLKPSSTLSYLLRSKKEENFLQKKSHLLGKSYFARFLKFRVHCQ